MTRSRFVKVTSFLILAAVMLGAFAAPAQVAQAKSALVDFTFVNQSNRIASLRLYGEDGTFYYFWLRPGESKYYTPVRQVYQMSFYSCGTYVNEPLDLTKKYTFVVPPCGTHAYGKNQPPKTLDGGKILKLVAVTLVNDTGNYMKLILTGPATYVFTFGSGESKDYTIRYGEYTYTLYGCHGSFTDTFLARAHLVKEFKCP